jgi:hypothetical protein
VAIAERAVGAVAGANSGNVTGVLPTNSLDDILLAWAVQHDNVASTLAGFVFLGGVPNGAAMTLRLFGKRSNGAESAPLLTHAGGGTVHLVIASYSGVDNTLTIGVGAGAILRDLQTQTGNAATSPLTVTFPAISGVVAGDMVVCIGAQDTTDTSGGIGANWTPPATFTERIDTGRVGASSSNLSELADKLSGSGASVTASANNAGFAGTQNWEGLQLALSSAVGTPAATAPPPRNVLAEMLSGRLGAWLRAVAFQLIAPIRAAGAGAAGTVYAETGSIAAGGALSGADVYESAEAGSVLAGGLLSGADVAERAEAGSVLSSGLVSGADATTRAETGSLTTGGLLSGADAYQATEAGSVLAGGLLSGADVHEAVETGTVGANGLLSGASSTPLKIKAGSILSSGLLSGADVHEAVETGAVIAGALLSGADAATRAEAGALIAGALLSGADADIFVEAGSVATAALLSGTSQKVGAGKAGSVTAGGLLSGADVSERAESGTVLASGLVSAADAHTATEAGSLVASVLLSGADAHVAARTGSIAVFGELRGPADRTKPSLSFYGPPSPAAGAFGAPSPSGGYGPPSLAAATFGAPSPAAVSFGEPSPGQEEL